MKYLKTPFFIVIIATIIGSCKTSKNSFISRNYHSVATKFNVLFNGKEFFKVGVKKINDTYQDDYWSQLPIEPIKFEETKILNMPSFSGGIGAGFDDPVSREEPEKELTSFEKAEEKAVKAIQKHSMNIKGEERNSQIDDAYLLLGKSRYYSQRFIPAIEAFNYVIVNYPGADLINETKIWRAKANIRNDNEEFAIESLRILVENKDGEELIISDAIREEAYTALAMAYVKMDSVQRVKESLQKATRTFKNKEQSARNLFVLGQIYGQENKKDSAVLVFDKLSQLRNAPYRYKMQANIALAQNFPKDSSSTGLMKRLQKLIKNRDNRAYLDKLYYQVGVLHEKNDSLKLAIDFYNKSLKTRKATEVQKSYTYESLGNLYFDNANYQLASAYYDSVLTVSKEKKEVRIRRVKRKHKNLSTLIKYENTVTENDSILSIAMMSDEEQITYFEGYISKLKKQDEEEGQQKLNAENFKGTSQGGLSSNKKGKWYFYNSQSLNFGETEFKKVWGNRSLSDDWRWSSQVKTASKTNNINGETSEKVAEKNERYEVETYLKTVEKDEKKLQKLTTDRNTALYELGVIYKEQFVNLSLAIKRLERVLALNPDEALVLPINWHLFKIYSALEDPKAAIYKALIIKKYPTSKFAQVIQKLGKPVEEEKEITEIEGKYKAVYYLYKENKFEECLLKIDENLKMLTGSKLIPKFELLKALTIGKHKDKETYKTALEYVTISYGNTEEGKRAKEIMGQLIK